MRRQFGAELLLPLQAKEQGCRRLHQPFNPPSIRSAEFRSSPAQC